MNPYFSAYSYNPPADTLLVLPLPALQLARMGPNVGTGSLTVAYRLTDRWTIGGTAGGRAAAAVAGRSGARGGGPRALTPVDGARGFVEH